MSLETILRNKNDRGIQQGLLRFITHAANQLMQHVSRVELVMVLPKEYVLDEKQIWVPQIRGYKQLDTALYSRFQRIGVTLQLRGFINEGAEAEPALKSLELPKVFPGPSSPRHAYLSNNAESSDKLGWETWRKEWLLE